MYVTLEPCSHHGLTPPCADMIIAEQIPRVVVASMDPNPKVQGKGIARLKAAGVQVEEHVLSAEARDLNARFFTFHEKQRPYVVLKWAQTHDGFLAREDHSSKWISNEHSRQLVHKWRTEEAAILVGANTVRHDNPKLTARDWVGPNPVRVVLDMDLKLDIREFAIGSGDPQTIIINGMRNQSVNGLEYIKVDHNRVLLDTLSALFDHKVQSVLVEGGAKTLNTFLEAGLWDEARVFTSSTEFGKGINAPATPPNPIWSRNVVNDKLRTYKNPSPN